MAVRSTGGKFLQERIDGGFPDDRDAAGPTIISTESLVEVASWFGLTLNESCHRFRMNLNYRVMRMTRDG